MKHWKEIHKNLLILTQLGLSFIMPLMLCIALCWFLTAKCYLGGWVYIPGFFFGLGGSAMTAYKFYLATLKQDEKEKMKKKDRISYNRHL